MTENNDINQLNDKASPKDEEDIIELTDVVSDTEHIELPDYTDEAISVSEEEVIEFDDDILNNLEDDLNNDIEIDHYLDNEVVDSADLDSKLDVSKDLSLKREEEADEDLFLEGEEEVDEDLFLESQEEADELEQLIADVVEDSKQEVAYEKETASDTNDPIPLSPEQVDEALERVIIKMYADKIESTLTEIIKEIITKEIEGLKALLLEDTEKDL